MNTLQIAFSVEQSGQLRAAYAAVTEHLERNRELTTLQLEQLNHLLADVAPWAATPGRWHLHAKGTDSDLLNLPWHLLTNTYPDCHISRGTPLTENETMLYFRPSPTDRLKVLILVAAPDDRSVSRLNYELEEQVILEALAPLLILGSVEIDFTEDGSLESLRKHLVNEEYHILYISSHGAFVDDAKYGGDGVLVLEEENSMAADLVTAHKFAEFFSAPPIRLPSLIFLSSCQSGRGSSQQQFTGIANRLLEVGIPAVIAMNWSVVDFWATRFASIFFQALTEREPLHLAFNYALQRSRIVFRENLSASFFQSQALIPQLFLSQKVEHLVEWTTSKSVRLTKLSHNLLENSNQLAYKLKRLHQIKGEPNRDYLFIGRRRERKKALSWLRRNNTVLICGQGGMGKTALAEHLAVRLLAENPVNCIPFIFDETDLSINNLMTALIDHLADDRGYSQLRAELAIEEDIWKKFERLLGELKRVGTLPLWIFDNLETLQDEINGQLVSDNGVAQLVAHLIECNTYPIILTSRYPIKVREGEEDRIKEIDLGASTFGDYLQKSLQLANISGLKVPGRAFEQTVHLLHDCFGGNFRALELFEEGLNNRHDSGEDSILALDEVLQKHSSEVVQQMAKNLILDMLLAKLSGIEQNLLDLLRQFRRPVLPRAIMLQGIPENQVNLGLHKLHQLTLVEVREYQEGNFYYVSGLVRIWMEYNYPHTIALRHNEAGNYYEYVTMETVHGQKTDLEEAFFHYSEAGKFEKVDHLGDVLSKFYYQSSAFADALRFAMKTEQFVGINVSASVLNTIAMVHTVFGQNQRAREYFDASLAKYKLENDTESAVILLVNRGQILSNQGEYDEALKCYQQAASVTGDDNNRSVAWFGISKTYILKGEFDQSRIWAEKTLALSQEIDNQQVIGDAYSLHGHLHFLQSDFKEATRYFEESLNIQRTLENRKVEAEVLNNLGRIAEVTNQFEKALSYYEQCLRIYLEIHDRQGEATVLINMGTACIHLDKSEQSLQYFKYSQNIAMQTDNRNILSASLHNQAAVYERHGDYSKAKSCLLESINLRSDIGDLIGESASRNNYAGILFHEKNMDGALEQLYLSLEILKITHDFIALGKTLANLGVIQFSISQYKEAIISLSQGLIFLKDTSAIEAEIAEQYLEKIAEIIGRQSVEDVVKWALVHGEYIKHFHLQIQLLS